MTTTEQSNQPDPDEQRRRWAMEEHIKGLRQLGVDEALIAPLEVQLQESAPTLHDYLPTVLAAARPGSLKTYKGYWKQLDEGTPWMCACACPACLAVVGTFIDRAPAPCPCETGACACTQESMLGGRTSCDQRFFGLGQLAMARITPAQLEEAKRWARIKARRIQMHKNVKRAENDRAQRSVDGGLAEEHAIRLAWRLAANDPATRVLRDMDKLIKLPARVERPARHRSAGELEEVWDVVWNGGDDPDLDITLVWFHLEGGARRAGAVNLRCGDLDFRKQSIVLSEKNDSVLPQPVSEALLRSLVGIALARGNVVAGAPDGVDPGDVTVDMVYSGLATLRPDAPVLYYQNHRKVTVRQPLVDEVGTPVLDVTGKPRYRNVDVAGPDGEPQYAPCPLTRRRYNTLFDRIQEALPWADHAGLRSHDLRTTGSVFVERATSYATARAWLRHRAGNPTDTYVKANFSEAAAAVALLTGAPHPAAESGGIEE
jgi:hypothetical protein